MTLHFIGGKTAECKVTKEGITAQNIGWIKQTATCKYPRTGIR